MLVPVRNFTCMILQVLAGVKSDLVEVTDNPEACLDRFPSANSKSTLWPRIAVRARMVHKKKNRSDNLAIFYNPIVLASTLNCMWNAWEKSMDRSPSQSQT